MVDVDQINFNAGLCEEQSDVRKTVYVAGSVKWGSVVNV